MNYLEVSEKVLNQCSNVFCCDVSEVHKKIWGLSKKYGTYCPKKMDKQSLDDYYCTIARSYILKYITNTVSDDLQKKKDDELKYESGIVIRTRDTPSPILMDMINIKHYIKEYMWNIPKAYEDIPLFIVHDEYNEDGKKYQIFNYENLRRFKPTINEVDNYDNTTSYHFDIHVMPFIEY